MNQPAFYFDSNLCTGCAACAIACQIENQMLPVAGKKAAPPWRTIYSHNPVNLPELASFHLTLACNHCLEPACLQSCPAAAITKDSLTGAVLINPKTCIGCGYCAWACPFDAPKYNQATGIMEKCTFCQPRLQNSRQPACTAACPTGALQLGLLSHETPGMMASMSGFPKTTMKPAMRFIPLRRMTISQPEGVGLELSTSRVIVGTGETRGINGDIKKEMLLYAQHDKAYATEGHPVEISLKHEWPLWVLTTVMPVLFAWFAGLPAERHAPYPYLDACIWIIGLLALLISTLHLGKPWRFWRAISNANTSWLSREILFTIAFLGLSGVAFGLTRIGTNDFLYRSGLVVQISLLLIGLLALVSIDQVYAVLRIPPYSSDELYRPRLQAHSASTVLAGLFIAAVLTLAVGSQGQVLPSAIALIGLFCGITQLCLYANRHADKEATSPAQAMLHSLRVALGFILPGILIASRAHAWLPIAFAITGFAIDRVEFYESLKRVKPGW